jgi:hypothetical protein
MPELSTVGKDAADLLAQNGNRLLLIEAIAVSLVPVSLYVTWNAIFTSVLALPTLAGNEAALLWVRIAYGVGNALLTLFLTLPLLVGLFGLAARIERGEDAVLAMLFSPFSGKAAYWRALQLSWEFLWRLCAMILAVALTYLLTLANFAGSFSAGLVCAGLILLELGVGLWVCARHFAVMAFAADASLPLSLARGQAHALTRCYKSAGVRFWMYFLPWLLLGLLTFGILLLADVFPKMLISYFRYCRRLFGKGISDEK